MMVKVQMTERWIGEVMEVEGDLFTARLRRWGEDYPRLLADFSMKDCDIKVRDGDEILVIPGRVTKLDPIWTRDHLGPEEVRFLSPDSELEQAEIGSRASRTLKAWDFAGLLGEVWERHLNAISIFMGQVAASTSRRGTPYPRAWDLPKGWQAPIPDPEEMNGSQS